MGVGIIVRDNMGMALTSICMSIMYIIDPTTAEAYAAWNTIFFGRDLGL
jgi:hypothetical protein